MEIATAQPRYRVVENPNPAGRQCGGAFVPERSLERVLSGADATATILTWQEDLKLQAGVSDIADLRNGHLEECDRLARRTGRSAQVLAIAEGAATGAGGVWTTLLDVPLLFVLGLRTIRKMGCGYGYHLEQAKDRMFVLGVLLVALSGSLEIRRERLQRLRELEEMLVEETVEGVLVEEIVSFIFQLEVFDSVPGIGAISGAVLNMAFMHQVDNTARRIFQERWLRDNGKVRRIEPAEAHPRVLASGLSGVLRRGIYAGSYYVGFGLALPACILALPISADEYRACARRPRRGGGGRPRREPDDRTNAGYEARHFRRERPPSRRRRIGGSAR
jgi:hypothetical protein